MRRGSGHSEECNNTVGIITADRNCRNTYIWLAIAAANYLTGVRRKRVAVVGMAGTNELENLAWYYGEKLREGTFSLFGVRYYPCYREGIMQKLMNGGFEYIIFNGGQGLKNNYKELLGCQRKIVAGSLKAWEEKEYAEMLRQLTDSEALGNSWRFAAECFDDRDKRRLEKQFGISIISLPCGINPFYIKRTEFAFFEALL